MPSPPQPPEPSVPPWAADPGAAPPYQEPAAASEPPPVPGHGDRPPGHGPPPAGGPWGVGGPLGAPGAPGPPGPPGPVGPGGAFGPPGQGGQSRRYDPYRSPQGQPYGSPQGPYPGGAPAGGSYPGGSYPGSPYPGDPYPGDPYPAAQGHAPHRVATTCYRHPDRAAGVTCQRCNRYICPSCMVQAPVGFHCPECVKQAARSAPVHDVRTLPTVQPLVTYGLIAINVAVFIWDMATMNQRLGLGTPSRYGMLYGVDVAAGEWWRLYTAGFLHASITHIAFNMFALYVLGRQLEGALGHFRFAAVYFAALCAGALGVILVSPTQPTVGASGAIYGLFGVALAYQLLKKINIMQSGLGPVLLLNLAFTFFVPGISIGGHLGGLIGGAVVGYVMFTVEDRSQSPLLGYAAAFAVMIGCSVAAVALAPVLIAG